ncbi:hypothetical protein D3C81_06970 [compost metagenome]
MEKGKSGRTTEAVKEAINLIQNRKQVIFVNDELLPRSLVAKFCYFLSRDAYVEGENVADVITEDAIKGFNSLYPNLKIMTSNQVYEYFRTKKDDKNEHIICDNNINKANIDKFRNFFHDKYYIHFF